MIDINTTQTTNELFSALGEQLELTEDYFELVIVGGSALLALGLIERVTRDVDVLALRLDSSLVKADPMPSGLIKAADRVANDFGLPRNWLNTGPASLLDLGLPERFDERLERVQFGSSLIVYYASRFDQIHFKLYALVDQGPGKHEADLRALKPSSDELIAAGRWARTHDPSPGFLGSLIEALRYLGVDNADLGAT